MHSVFPRFLLAPALVVVGVAEAAAQNLWIVDAQGGGDFTQLAAAVTAASPGDLVWILPGDYAAVATNKRLTLIGAEGLPRPRVAGLDLLAVESFQTVHLELGAVRLSGTGRVLIDGCLIGPGAFWPNTFGSFLVTAGSDLLLSRSEVQGSYAAADGAPALVAELKSSVQIVSSTLRGPSVPASNLFKLSGYGGPALVLRSNARCWAVDSNLIGGAGQDYIQGSAFQPGAGGAGVSLLAGSQLDLRGRSKNLLSGGLQNPGLSGPDDGPAVFCQPGSNPPAAELGPISIVGSLSTCVTQAASPRAFLVPESELVGSSQRRASCYGSPGQAALLAASFQTDLSLTPLVSGTPLFLDLNALTEVLPLVLTGFENPVTVAWQAPAGWPFAGLAYSVQLFELPATGGFSGANSISFLLTP